MYVVPGISFFAKMESNEVRIDIAPGSVQDEECSSTTNSASNAAAAAVIAHSADAPPAPAASVAAAANQEHELGHVTIEIQSNPLNQDESVEKDDEKDDEDDEDGDGKVCRVCHLSLYSRKMIDQQVVTPTTTTSMIDMEAIQLGCGCKDDLSNAHRRCAETWFKIKGNRTCEICGQQAQNISGFVDDFSCGRPSDERSDSGFGSEAGGNNAGNESRSFWHHRPICNFVLAFIVVVLLLPWLFRIRLF